MEGMNTGIKVYGISVRQPGEKQEEAVCKLACETAEYVAAKGGVSRGSVVVDGGYVGPGYGQPTKEMVEAVHLAARKEGILVDPVYSGKGMAGLIGLVREGPSRRITMWCSCRLAVQRPSWRTRTSAFPLPEEPLAVRITDNHTA
jgi:1-aminocyclopropane-1-carboxylate deaminase/D-cysteine desulfhydrase-like pyridoxal-dependent ACC family enzyme